MPSAVTPLLRLVHVLHRRDDWGGRHPRVIKRDKSTLLVCRPGVLGNDDAGELRTAALVLGSDGGNERSGASKPAGRMRCSGSL
jgi:hypothetical protein